jgi:putative transcriptional regulator
MAKQYRSPVMASIHETAEGMHAAGVMDKQTIRRFDDACLTPVRPLMPAEIRSLRDREGASQAVFARYLNVTTGLVSQWERGEKHPQGASLKLLSPVVKHGLRKVAQGRLMRFMESRLTCDDPAYRARWKFGGDVFAESRRQASVIW